MRTQRISSDTVKVFLTKRDIHAAGITAGGLMTGTPRSEAFLRDLTLRTIPESRDRDARRASTRVFPSKDGGCVVYISEYGTDLIPFLITVSSVDGLLRTLRLLSEPDSRASVTLYAENAFIRIIADLPKDGSAAEEELGGFASVIPADETVLVRTEEHGRLIARKRPVNSLIGALAAGKVSDSGSHVAAEEI